MTPLRYGSVCSGIEAATCAWHPLGWVPQWFSEIETFPNKVLAHHYPDVPNLGDMTKLHQNETFLKSEIDVLVGGTPCQSFSLAGLRQGLADPRGNLTLTFLQLVEIKKPKYIVWENVPGILSDQTKALESFLDGLEKIGYAIIGCDILDAQYFGLAQRRRRIFVCAQNIQDLLNKKTAFSGLIVAQWFIEILRHTLGVLSAQLSHGSANYNSESTAHETFLKKKIGLFNPQKEEQVQKLLDCLNVLRVWSECGPAGLESIHGKSSNQPQPTTANIKSSKSSVMENGSQNIDTLWKNQLVEALKIARLSITSTASKETTESKIFICAKAVQIITGYMVPSMASLLGFSHAAVSSLTTLKEYMNYARLTSNDFFGDMGAFGRWIDFIGQTESTNETLSNIGIRNFNQILSVSESLSGDIAPGREEGEGTPRGFETGPHAGGYTDVAPTLDAKAKDVPVRNQIGVGIIAPEISPAIKSRDYKGVSSNGFGDGIPLITGALTNAGGKSAGSATNQDADAGMLIVEAISFKAAVGRTGSGQPDSDVVASLMSQHKSGDQTPLVAIRTANTGANGHGIAEDVAHTLDQAQGQAVMYENHPSDSRIKEVDVAPNLNSRAGTGGNNLPLIQEVAPTLRAMPGQGPGRMADDAGTMGMVRRLTPRECERLQGFPDDYTLLLDKKGKACADGPRYKALGNSMAVPVMAYIGRRIQMVDDILKDQKT